MSGDGKVNGEVVLNLADWIERRRDAVGPYADHIIHSVRAHEAELSRLRADVERLKWERDVWREKMDYALKCERDARAALSDERAHADSLAELVDSQVNEFWTWWDDEAEKLLAQHRARRSP